MAILTSKVTERSQTTLPPGVRKVLDLEPGERVGYVIKGSRVEMVNASAIPDSDPVLANFLEFLESDMAGHPERIGFFPKSLLHRARSLTRRVKIDHDADIEGVTAL